MSYILNMNLILWTIWWHIMEINHCKCSKLYSLSFDNSSDFFSLEFCFQKHMRPWERRKSTFTECKLRVINSIKCTHSVLTDDIATHKADLLERNLWCSGALHNEAHFLSFPTLYNCVFFQTTYCWELSSGHWSNECPLKFSAMRNYSIHIVTFTLIAFKKYFWKFFLPFSSSHISSTPPLKNIKSPHLSHALD